MITLEERARLRNLCTPLLACDHMDAAKMEREASALRALPALLNALEAAEAERDEIEAERRRVVVAWGETKATMREALEMEQANVMDLLRGIESLKSEVTAAESRAATAREEADALRKALAGLLDLTEEEARTREGRVVGAREDEDCDERTVATLERMAREWREPSERARALLPTPEAPQESTLDRYERLADEFWRETGYMAPGKDAPAMLYTEEQDAARRVVWDAWIAKRNAAPEAT